MEEDYQGREQADPIEWDHNPKRVQKELSKQSHQLRNIQALIDNIQMDLLNRQLAKTAQEIQKSITVELHDQARAVFLVHFSQGQSNDLEKFIQLLDLQIKTLEKGLQRNVTLQHVNDDDIMGIMLKIYTIIEESDGAPTIFMIKKITNFDYKDVPILHKSLDKGLYYIIMPTYKELIEIETMNYNQFFHVELYNEKQLFLQFMINALMDVELKAYLPPEILNLITDLDYYPISYRESVRRFSLCTKRLYFENHWRFVPVQFSNLYHILNQVLMDFSFHGNFRIEERFIRTVLDQDYVFKIPKSLVDRQILKADRGEEIIDDSNLDKMARLIRKRLQQDISLSKYAPYMASLKTSDVQVYEGTHSKKDRMKSLRIPKAGLTKHDMLNQQITKIIREATSNIRSQAKQVSWQKVSYEEYCRPQVLKHICQDVKKDPLLKNIFGATRQYIEISHKDMFNHLDLPLNQYHYRMTELQYLGLVEQSKKQIDPSFFNQFFKKADYRM